ncbi:hypothetical protein VHEMI00776 [[Torrubiella] hemipterigena]|uniref:Potassium transport protein n=1 Tax=[Torrubiella] hemipterigena TaxID=1531966 RepID=A0A0A1T2W8_9HYPO|nr:hypothetical protein VHEMI00776 [[Torrubiella] hemipterigena]
MEREVDMPDPPQRSWTARVRKHLPPLTFISIHYAYFIVFAMIGSVIFWKSSSDERPVSYVDSLFLIVSAMTLAGLNTVNLSELTTWQQFLLFFYIMLGSTIWVSIWTVLARKQVFSRRFDDIARAQRAKMSASVLSFRRTLSFRKAVTEPIQHTSSVLPGPVIKKHASDFPDVDENTLANARRRRDSVPEPNHTANHEPKPTSQDKTDEKENHIAFQDTPHPRQQQEKAAAGEAGDENNSDAYSEDDRGQTMRYFLKHRASGRHGEFHSLTSEERTQLGGCEYSALRILAVVVPLYFAMWQILGCVALGAWINNNMPDTARQNGINPWWLGIFNGVSAFNNSGMSLLDANMVPFQGAYFVLITMGLMILAGNTAYPIFLRFIFWSFLRILRLTTRPEALSHFKLTLQFILKYPRRVYTNLFPSRATWWLLFMLIGLNCVDWVAFEIFNIGNPVIESIPTGPRVLDGLFQALAVRSGGFYVVPIAQISIAIQFLYVVMMYISVYPVVITMRHSNVYEERSLGIYQDDIDSESESNTPLLVTGSSENVNAATARARTAATTNTAAQAPPLHLAQQLRGRPTLMRQLSQSIPATEIGRALQRSFTPWHGVGVPPVSRNGPIQNTPLQTNMSFVRQQVHGQLAHDIWWLVLAVFIITAIESSHFNSDPVAFSVFNIIFEVVSAYGTVGISVGVPTAAYSFCGAWHTASKLVLCLVMIRGRHRGLPVALDHAVRLPGEHLHKEEEEDNRIRRSLSINRRRESMDV